MVVVHMFEKGNHRNYPEFSALNILETQTIKKQLRKTRFFVFKWSFTKALFDNR